MPTMEAVIGGRRAQWRINYMRPAAMCGLDVGCVSFCRVQFWSSRYRRGASSERLPTTGDSGRGNAARVIYQWLLGL
jgi:hypothetical protein